MKKAYLYRKRASQLTCTACVRYCTIPQDEVGFCQTRLNKDGELYSLIYGVANGLQIDPVEKKPLYHFYPGSRVLSIGSFGCNFRCRQCLNSWCSYGEPADGILKKLAAGKKQSVTTTISPQEVVAYCRKSNCPGIAFTYNEPAIWPEFVHDTANLAKKNGLFTCFISNGSWSKESLAYLGKAIDAVNIDIKGYYAATYRAMGAYYPKILENTVLALQKYKIHMEITTLVIPTINDSTKELTAVAHFIKTKLGAKIPWHLSRFDPSLSPDKKWQKLPCTPQKTLDKAYRIGKKEGLDFIYVWAPPKNHSEELYAITKTYCPACQKLVIDRDAWRLNKVNTNQQGKCKYCGESLYLKN